MTAERDAYREEARDYHEREVQRFMRLLDGQVTSDHLTITLSGPQGCGKTRFAEALRNILRRFGATVQGEGCDEHPGSLMKDIVGDGTGYHVKDATPATTTTERGRG